MSMDGNIYTVQAIVFTAAGAIFLWCKLGRDQLTIWGLGKLWRLCGFKSKLYEVMELVGFVASGVTIGIAATHPQTIMQAISAGLGWTGLLTTPRARTDNVTPRKRRSGGQ